MKMIRVCFLGFVGNITEGSRLRLNAYSFNDPAKS
jgi:hypothetical protein